jgi:hypothetical protein
MQSELSPEERAAIMQLREPHLVDHSDSGMLDSVLAGEDPMDISHAGGEFNTMLEDDNIPQ